MPRPAAAPLIAVLLALVLPACGGDRPTPRIAPATTAGPTARADERAADAPGTTRRGIVTLGDYAAAHERACRRLDAAADTFARRLRLVRRLLLTDQAAGVEAFRRSGLGVVADLRAAARTFADAVPARGYAPYQRRLRREFRRIEAFIDRDARRFRGVRTFADIEAISRRLGRYPGGGDVRVPRAILGRAPTCRLLFGPSGRTSGGAAGRLV